MGILFGLSSRSSVPIPFTIWDKYAHASAYGVLSLLVVWAMASGAWRRITFVTVVLATLVSVVYGWSDEVHQLFVPARQYDWLDLGADTTGAFLAAVGAWAWGIILRGSDKNHGG